MSLLWVLTSLAFGQGLPQVQAETLSGAKINLPASLSAGHTALVLSFKRDHQEVSNSWRPHLAALSRAGKADWLELAFLDVSSPMRLAIGTAMDLGIRDATARAHVAPVWSSHASIRQALGIASDSQVVVVVVDKAGQVTHKVSGAPTAAAVAALQGAVQ